MSNNENNQTSHDDRQERLKLIEKLLEGISYNNTTTREAITVSGSGQLQATVQILVKMVEHMNTGRTAKTVTVYST